MHPEMRPVARDLDGLVSVWLLRHAGWTASAIRHRTRGMRRLHDGVYVTGEGPLTDRQRRRAATLTAPDRALARFSAAAAWGFRRYTGGRGWVVAPGEGGPRPLDGVIVCRSTVLHPDGSLRDVTRLDGLPITTPERTVADLWPRLRIERERHKLLREALRLQRTTVAALRLHLETAPARNSPKALADLLERYARLGLQRCRSDAEARAIELLDVAGLPLPQVNVRIAREEADLSWPARRLIVEIDGGQFHLDKAEDARRTAIWRAAGWRVIRVSSDLVFDHPARFVALVRGALAGE